MKYLIAIACHFEAPNKICRTTERRLETVLSLARPDDYVIVTGHVPYEKGGTNLGILMAAWLLEHGWPGSRVSTLNGGVGTFSEARIACAQLESWGVKEVTIVSSDWYLFQAKPIWKRRAKESGIKIRFVPVSDTGGMRTKLLYVAIGLLVRVATLFGLERQLEDRLTKSQQNRINGFKFDGCR